jgi:hypothetical protein
MRKPLRDKHQQNRNQTYVLKNGQAKTLYDVDLGHVDQLWFSLTVDPFDEMVLPAVAFNSPNALNHVAYEFQSVISVG